MRSPHHYIFTCSAADGYPLHCRRWPSIGTPVARLIMVHGVVSHSLWLQSIARRLQAAGVDCIGFDRRGAGLNQAQRGHCNSAAELISDLAAVVEQCSAPPLPLFLAGFCWGSNYVVHYLGECEAQQDGQQQATGGERPICRPPAGALLLAPSLFPSELIQQQPFAIGSDTRATEVPVMPLECFTQGEAYKNFIVPDPLRVRAVSLRMNSVMQSLSRGVWMKLLRSRTPLLAILASEDQVVDNNATRRVLQRRASGTTHWHEVPGHHGVQFDAPERCAALMRQWINHSGAAA